MLGNTAATVGGGGAIAATEVIGSAVGAGACEGALVQALRVTAVVIAVVMAVARPLKLNLRVGFILWCRVGD